MDFVYRSAEGKICVNFENLQENSNELSHISYDKIQKVTMLPVADILADAPVKTDDEQDCSEVYVVYLHDGTAKEEFDKEFFSQAAVSIEGKGVEYSEGAIRLTGDVKEGKVTFTSGYKTLEVEISNYIAPPVVPEDVEGFTYRFFAVGETTAVADILAANEIVSSYYNIVSLSDEKAVTEKDGSLSAQDYFDAVTGSEYADLNREETTNANGELTFSDLTEGRYKIVESAAPAGYNNLTGAIYFTISVDGVVTWTDENGNTINSQSMIEYNSTDKTFVVGNNPGVELPATGGPGTLVYTVTGLTLTLGAALWLIFSRRKREQN